MDGLDALQAMDNGDPQPRTVELAPGLADGVTIKLPEEPALHTRKLLKTLGAGFEVDPAAPGSCEHGALAEPDQGGGDVPARRQQTEHAGEASAVAAPPAPRAREQLLEEIRELAARLGRPPRLSDSGALVGRATVLFGSWSAFLEAAGFDPPVSHGPGPAVPPRVSETTRRSEPEAAPEPGAAGGARTISGGAAAAGTPAPAAQDERRERSTAPAEPEASGSQQTESRARKHGPPSKWTRDTILARVTERAEALGRPPFFKECGMGIEPIEREFGSWGDLCVAVGWTRPRRGKAAQFIDPPETSAADASPTEPTPIDRLRARQQPDPEPEVAPAVADETAANEGDRPTDRREWPDLRDLARDAFAGILDALTDRLAQLPASCCVACGNPFLHDQAVTLVPLGPGDDHDARERAREGGTYSARAVPVHRACATGLEDT